MTWISMKTPPKKTGSYLVAEDGWRVRDASWDGQRWLRKCSLFATHWQELPDPPSGEELAADYHLVEVVVVDAD